jgi:hypothetical protein
MSYLKKGQVDCTKEISPGGEKYRASGDVEKLEYNPKPNAFDVGTNVQQTIDTNIGKQYKSEAPSIPASEIKPMKSGGILNWFKKKADDGKSIDPNSAQYKAQGDKGKLEFPTGKADTVTLKQKGLETSEEAGSKTYRDQGTKEKLEIPTGKVELPKASMNVSEDLKIGNQYKDEGEKEKLMTSPSNFKVNVSQEVLKVNVPIDTGNKAAPQQKQFALGINWFKRGAKTTPEAQEYISKKIEKNVEEGKPQEQAIAIAHSQAKEKGFDVPKTT